MMKRTLALVCLMVLLLGLAACGETEYEIISVNSTVPDMDNIGESSVGTETTVPTGDFAVPSDILPSGEESYSTDTNGTASRSESEGMVPHPSSTIAGVSHGRTSCYTSGGTATTRRVTERGSTTIRRTSAYRTTMFPPDTDDEVAWDEYAPTTKKPGRSTAVSGSSARVTGATTNRPDTTADRDDETVTTEMTKPQTTLATTTTSTSGTTASTTTASRRPTTAPPIDDDGFGPIVKP